MSGALLTATALSLALAAQDTGADDETLAATEFGPEVATAAVAVLPVREAISELARRAGLVVIFDGRKVAEGGWVEIDRTLKPKIALETLLASNDLELRPIGSRTFAIADAAAKAPAATEAVILSDARFDLMDTIVVTGLAPATGLPLAADAIVDIDEESLTLLNEARVADVIFDLPQSIASFSSANTTLYGATAGLNLADLRGLGPEATQVLVNGRRRTPFVGGNGTVYGVDLTTIPHAMLDRIEIVDYTQSTLLGPEAFVGSVNLVLGTDTDGFEGNLTYGVSEKGDAVHQAAYAGYGGHFAEDRGHAFLGIELAREDGLLGRERQLTASPYGFDYLAAERGAELAFLPDLGGSRITPAGMVSGLLLDDGTILPTGRVTPNRLLTGEGTLEPFEGRGDQFYNWSAAQSRVLPNERALGIAAASFDGDGWSAFSELHFGFGRTDVSLSPVPLSSFFGSDPVTGDALRIDIDDPRVPAAIAAEFSGLPNVRSLLISQRLVALGDRQDRIDRTYVDWSTGIEVPLSENTVLASHYRLGWNDTEMRQDDRVNLDRLSQSLSADCSAIPDCLPIQPFFRGGIDEGAAFIRQDGIVQSLSVREHELSLELDHGFVLGTRTADLLSGLRYRHTEGSSAGPSVDLSRVAGATAVSTYDGDYGEFEAFTHLTLPLSNEDSYLGRASLSGGARAIYSDGTGWTRSGELGGDWTPRSGVTLRGTYANAERPPNLTERFLIGRYTARTLTDPCTPNLAGEGNIRTNCDSGGSLGVPPNFAGTNGLSDLTWYGREDIAPETIETARVDLILEPQELWPDLPGRSRFRVSYTDYDVGDGYVILDEAQFACYESPGLSSLACQTNPATGLPYIRRDQTTGALIEVGQPLVNRRDLTWRGLDFEARLSMRPDWPAIDRVWAAALHTHILETEATLFEEDLAGTGGPEVLIEEDRLGRPDFPRNRSQITAGIERGDHTLQTQILFRDEVSTLADPDPIYRIDAFTTVDLTWRWAVSDNVRLTATVANLGDAEPEMAAGTEGLNVLAQHYDIVGRRFQFALDFRF
jgi:outer membrane receptor protein involved in Fe transport